MFRLGNGPSLLDVLPIWEKYIPKVEELFVEDSDQKSNLLILH